MDIALLAQIRLPKGVTGPTKELLATHRHQLVKSFKMQVLNIHPGAATWFQSHKDAQHAKTILDTLLPYAGGLSTKEPCVLLFRDVEEHTDEMASMYRGYRRYVGAFLHVVLHGSATVTCGARTSRTRKVWTMRKGDVFAMDVTKPHAVTSKRACVTACFVVPRVDIPKWRAPALTDRKVLPRHQSSPMPALPALSI